MNINNLKRSHFEEIEIPLAPLAEQKRIADKLDRLLAAVDTCKARLDAIPDILKRFRQSVLAAAVSGELTEEWRGLHGIHSPWSKALLGNVAFVTKLAGFEYTKYVRYTAAGDLKVLKAENAGPRGFRQTAYSRVDASAVAHLTRSRVYAGDLLMVFVGAGTGQVARVPKGDDWFLGPNIALIRPHADVLSPAYLEQYMRSPTGWNQVFRFIKSVAQPSLSMKAIRSMEIQIPSREEQSEIVNRIDALFSAADRVEAHVKRISEKLDTTVQGILARAFRGELVMESSDKNIVDSNAAANACISSKESTPAVRRSA